jgi:hypothetical protein
MNSEWTRLLTYQKPVSLSFPAEGAVLNFFGADESRWRYSIDSPLFSGRHYARSFRSLDNVPKELVVFTLISQLLSQMSVPFYFSSSLSIRITHCADSFRYPRSAVISCARSSERTVLFTSSEKRRFVSRYAARHSGWRVRGLHCGHLQLSRTGPRTS